MDPKVSYYETQEYESNFMNLFILDEDVTKCAQAHIDKHVGKMQLEATQLLTTAVWVDHLLGHVPRNLTTEELRVISAEKAKQPSIDERTFTRYLPTHVNHPCAVWVRSSLDNFYWTQAYVMALNTETQWRGNNSHASCAEAMRLPLPKSFPAGMTPFAQAMPDEYKNSADVVDAYRHYYMGEKACMAVWKRRGKPTWWDEEVADYKGGMDPHQSYLNVKKVKHPGIERML